MILMETNVVKALLPIHYHQYLPFIRHHSPSYVAGVMRFLSKAFLIVGEERRDVVDVCLLSI